VIKMLTITPFSMCHKHKYYFILISSVLLTGTEIKIIQEKRTGMELQ